MPPIRAALGHDHQTTAAFTQHLLGKDLVVLAESLGESLGESLETTSTEPQT